MSKVYTDAEFSARTSEDRTWRIKEISDLKSAAKRAGKDENLRRVLLRALVTICYAHWEGSVRFAARTYLEYIAVRKLNYSELDRQFLCNYFLPRLAALSVSRTSISDRCALVEDVLDSSKKRFSRANNELIDTRSNLNFGVLKDICTICGVPIASFEDHETFIDIILLKRRNAIAHGEETYVEIDGADELAERTIKVMRAFGEALENQFCLGQYRANSTESFRSHTIPN